MCVFVSRPSPHPHLCPWRQAGLLWPSAVGRDIWTGSTGDPNRLCPQWLSSVRTKVLSFLLHPSFPGTLSVLCCGVCVCVCVCVCARAQGQIKSQRAEKPRYVGIAAELKVATRVQNSTRERSGKLSLLCFPPTWTTSSVFCALLSWFRIACVWGQLRMFTELCCTGISRKVSFQTSCHITPSDQNGHRPFGRHECTWKFSLFKHFLFPKIRIFFFPNEN